MIKPPYIDNYKRGYFQHTSDPLKYIWGKVELFGTIDNLRRIINSRGHIDEIASDASLRIRQAIELRNASIATTTLTKPLMLYYSLLNLVRGFMSAYLGDFGCRSHGLSYRSGNTLLECEAIVHSKGTFPHFAKFLSIPEKLFEKNQSYKLKDLFALIPELMDEYHIINCGSPSIISLTVDGYYDGIVNLKYHFSNHLENEFESNWQKWFPWFSELCQYVNPNTLQLKESYNSQDEIAKFCSRFLIYDLENPSSNIWYDQIERETDTLLDRRASYLMALFILSNVSRYEPQLLNESTIGLTNLGYFLRYFFDKAERFFPQLMLSTVRDFPIYIN